MKKITDAEFATEVLASNKPVLVDIYADWCQPCKALAPVLEKVAAAYVGKADLVKMDGETAIETVTKYRVSALPTLMYFKDGELKLTVHGFQTDKKIRETLDSLM